MSDDIVIRLEQMASNFKTSEWEFVYADYETVCEASQEIERLRKLISDYVSLWGQVETGHFPNGVYDPENVVNAYYAKFHEMKQAVRGE